MPVRGQVGRVVLRADKLSRNRADGDCLGDSRSLCIEQESAVRPANSVLEAAVPGVPPHEVAVAVSDPYRRCRCRIISER